jgi:hypothetical protein
MDLHHSDLTTWRHRFFGFNDAVIRRWSLSATTSHTSLEVDIETRDLQSTRTGWSLVTLRIPNSSSVAYTRSGKMNYDVLSNGLHVIHEDGVFGLEFGHFVDAPENLDQLASSPCHAVAPRVDWKATEAG